MAPTDLVISGRGEAVERFVDRLGDLGGSPDDVLPGEAQDGPAERDEPVLARPVPLEGIRCGVVLEAGALTGDLLSRVRSGAPGPPPPRLPPLHPAPPARELVT